MGCSTFSPILFFNRNLWAIEQTTPKTTMQASLFQILVNLFKRIA